MSLQRILTCFLMYTCQIFADDYSANYRKAIYSIITPYRFVQDLLKDKRKDEGSTTFYDGRTCHIVNLNLLLRHGSRSPYLFEIKQINELYRKLIQDPQVANQFPLIKRWKNPFTEDQPYTQLDEGDREQALLGRRFGIKFQKIFKNKLNSVKYVVTNTSFAKRSYEVFSNSLHAYFRSDIQASWAEIDNRKLYFYKQCKNFDRLNKMAIYQYKLFLEGPEMTKVVYKVRKKLGTTNITTEEVLTIRKICSFEVGVFDKIEWCRLFDIDDLLVLDYLIDTWWYWQRSYGIRLNSQISCPYTANLFGTFDSVINNHGSKWRYKNAEIGFAHGFTLLPIFTAFGLFQDTSPLLASNYATHKRRLFRSGRIMPMSGNLAIALYKCDGYGAEYVVKMFVNEEPVIIPKCGSHVCSYYYFKALYKSLSSCDFEGLCENNIK